MMNSKTLLVAPFLGLLCGVCSAAEPAKLETENEKINYSVGYQLGADFKRQGITMDAESVVKGIEDALSGAEPLMDSKARNATLMELKRTVDAIRAGRTVRVGIVRKGSERETPVNVKIRDLAEYLRS